ncbi:hypothetical protein BJY14_004151 [Actinomadura luteofluorescens]|uniref:Uncharacterized protein n=1 Tax=Actinomadura luteofluorescens TaxID=46163 RepID=A0A7Y9EI49_9ACTN|nr:hypothetical protein [Actinomadura luteofluorescens]NYD48168.1 hypothetical protein [Actinomadura luteofluorescens]
MDLLLSYVLGLASALPFLYVFRTRRSEAPAKPTAVAADAVRDGGGPTPDRRLAELAETVIGLGEEIGRLTFDPAAPDVPPESLADYRRVLDGYSGATDALDSGDFEQVRQELAHARNALVRMDARAHRLPVPVDVSRAARERGGPPSPQPLQDRRFSYSGSNEREYTIPIDWPEPGRSAIMEVTRNGTGSTEFNSVLVMAEQNRPKTLRVRILGGSARARFYLATTPDSFEAPTHLRIAPSEVHRGTGTWTVRLHPLSEAVELVREHQGSGAEVLVHHARAPAVLGIHVSGPSGWEVEYRCLKKHGRWERCRFGRLETLMYDFLDEDRKSARICGPGLIVVHAAESARWSLSVAPPRPAPPSGPLSGIRRLFEI